MRHFVSLVVASLLVLGGLGVLYMQFFQADVISFGIVLGAGTAFGFGALWLWEEIRDPA